MSGMAIRRPGARPVAVLALAALLSSCASIPESSEPEAVKPMEQSNPAASVQPPPPGADAFGLVRSFVEASGSPASDHGSARMHLTGSADARWKPPAEMLVVDDVDTIPAPRPPDAPENVQVVSLQANKVGRLRQDQSFAPESGEYHAQVRVERKGDGQWRIVDPPRGLVASRASFTANYRATPIYFLGHDGASVVPDTRYVVAQPSSTLPRRAVDLLMSGPSQSFRPAMRSAIPKGAYPKTNASEAPDGALVVNLSELGNPSEQQRRLIAAQVVLSLQRVSPARVRLLEEGVPLLDQQELRPTDVAAYEKDNAARPDLPGLAVVDERVHVLDEDASPIPGPAGSGAYDVVQAAQSEDRKRLAAATRTPTGVVLRVGRYGGSLAEVPVAGTGMSRPTWRGGSEVWTVVDHRDVVRTFRQDGAWVSRPVDAREFSGGRPIGDLRISRDGTRAAGVVDGRIVVAAVAEEGGNVVLRNPTALSGGPSNAEVNGVDWLSNQSLVATTRSKSAPVLEVSVDGFQWTPYVSENLDEPLSSIAVGSGRRVVVADRNALWEASGPRDVWRFLRVPIGSGSIPFFPG